MSMLIRSQNKTLLVVLENCCAIDFIRREELYLIYAHDCSQEVQHLGNYSTREKAIKVLDMIQEQYEKHIYGQGGQMATADYYVSPFAFIPPKVFQMPQDSEV